MDANEFKEAHRKQLSEQVDGLKEHKDRADLFNVRFKDILSNLEIVREMNEETRIFSKEEMEKIQKFTKVYLNTVIRKFNQYVIQINTINENITMMDNLVVGASSIKNPDVDYDDDADELGEDDMDQDEPSFKKPR